jgi:hypothetical protein
MLGSWGHLKEKGPFANEPHEGSARGSYPRKPIAPPLDTLEGEIETKKIQSRVNGEDLSTSVELAHTSYPGEVDDLIGALKDGRLVAHWTGSWGVCWARRTLIRTFAATMPIANFHHQEGSHAIMGSGLLAHTKSRRK